MAEANLSDELARECRDLEKAEKDLVEGRQRVEDQQRLIDRLALQGHDTAEAQLLLHNFQHMLDAWHDHRELIVQRIALLESAHL